MRNAAILTTLSLTLALGGCANEVVQPAVLPQGLTVFEADVGTLALAYRSADVVIYMQALRGAPTPEPYQLTETAPRFQMDARFTDAEGYVFYSQQGGDGWLDPSWPEELDRQVLDRPEAASNEVLFRLAQEASALMHAEIEAQVGPELTGALAPEIRAIHDFASHARQLYEEELGMFEDARAERGMPDVQIDGPDGDVVYGSSGPEDSYWTGGSGYYYIDIRDEDIYEFGRHSATSLYRWSGSAWAHVHNFCNHGSCATSMPRKCLHQYHETNDADDYMPTWTVTTCRTGYSAWSDDGGHNCHDDSRGQTSQFIRGGTPLHNGYNYWCNGRDDDTDISVNIWGFETDQSGSPDCSSSCRRGYNFCG
ncbi:MAG: hypothetical protein M3Y87_21865 [Myxococcota bacterium]|nr:hypothetical protein [Myxococcota bacterium]